MYNAACPTGFGFTSNFCYFAGITVEKSSVCQMYQLLVLFCLTCSQNKQKAKTEGEKCSTERESVCSMVCVCVLDEEGGNVFPSRAPVVV